MRPILLALLTLGCNDPSSAPPLPFHQTGAGALVRLADEPAELALATSNLPEGTTLAARFELGPVAAGPTLVADGRAAYVFSLPFPSDPRAERFAPPGMRVLLDGQELAYDISPHAAGHTGWRLKGGQLHLVLPEDRGPLSVTVEHPELARRVARLEQPLSGLEPAEFVRYRERGDVSRAGLLLPAPSTAEWQVEIPEGATFGARPELVDPTPLEGLSTGATVVLTVLADGREVEVGRRRVGPPRGWWQAWFGPDPGAAWQVDLSPWAGRAVTLRLSTEPGEDPVHDYVFVGAPVVWGAPTAPVRRVVVIGLDTTRPDHLGVHGYHRDTTPELDALAAESAVFDAAWAPAPRTRPSFRSATTGRDPLDAVGATTIGQVFRDHGFSTAGIVANIHLNSRFGFDRGYDLWHLDPSASATSQVDRALAWLGEHEDRDAFLFLHLMDPHIVYTPPAPFRERFAAPPSPGVPELFNRWEILSLDARGELPQAHKDHIVDLYDAELAYTSHEVGRLVEGIEALGDNALVVLHTDHGEEFWEHGGFEHNHALFEELVHAALWVRPPGGGDGQRLDEPVALWDIAPTLFDWAGFTDVPETDGRSLRPLIEGRDPGGWDRPLPVGHLMYDREQWGVVWRGHKYVVTTASGEEALYDLAADPGEQVDLSDERDLAPFREALSRAHGMPVGPGWRVEVAVDPGEAITWELPAAAVRAWVMDPEADRRIRANQVWGETPDALPEDVGTVRLANAGRTLVFEPGPRGRGQVHVLFEAPVAPGGLLRRGRHPLRLREGRGGAWSHGAGAHVVAVPSVVLEPPPGEPARMAVEADAEQQDLDLLKALGYLGE